MFCFPRSWNRSDRQKVYFVLPTTPTRRLIQQGKEILGKADDYSHTRWLCLCWDNGVWQAIPTLSCQWPVLADSWLGSVWAFSSGWQGAGRLRMSPEPCLMLFWCLTEPLVWTAMASPLIAAWRCWVNVLSWQSVGVKAGRKLKWQTFPAMTGLLLASCPSQIYF